MYMTYKVVKAGYKHNLYFNLRLFLSVCGVCRKRPQSYIPKY